MKYSLLAAMLFAGLLPSLSSAVELKNIRPCYGPMGATRYDKKLLPGDVIFMTYDIEGLVLDDKTGKASYVTILELLDAQDKVLYKKDTPNEVMPQLGGTRMPGDLHLIMGSKQLPGRYSIRMTVHDKFGKDAKAFKYDFELSAESFGMIGVMAPAIGFPGQTYRAELNLVNLGLDSKQKPNTEVNIRILDQSGTAVAPAAVQILLPRDLPDDADLGKTNFVPLTYPVYLNRVGRYTMEIVAQDKISSKRSELRYPFTVIDLTTFTSGK